MRAEPARTGGTLIRIFSLPAQSGVMPTLQIKLCPRLAAITLLALVLAQFAAPANAGVQVEVRGVGEDIRANVLAYLSFERYKNSDDLSPEFVERLQERSEREVRGAIAALRLLRAGGHLGSEARRQRRRTELSRRHQHHARQAGDGRQGGRQGDGPGRERIDVHRHHRRPAHPDRRPPRSLQLRSAQGRAAARRGDQRLSRCAHAAQRNARGSAGLRRRRSPSNSKPASVIASAPPPSSRTASTMR